MKIFKLSVLIVSLSFLAVPAFATDADKLTGTAWPVSSAEQSNQMSDAAAMDAALESGNSWFMNRLGMDFLEATTVKRDPKRAFMLFEMAYRLGNSTAAYNIGLMYSKGELGLEDKTEGCDWYEKAAKLDNKLGYAYNNLAACYSSGEGRKKDEKKAVYFFKKAVETDDNNAMALCNLAKYYASGTGGLKKNRKKAKELCRKGYEMGKTERCANVWKEFNLGS